MSKVQHVARQLVDALPEDADFSDLDEFLWERAEVEKGRDDFEAGRTCSSVEVLSDPKCVQMSKRLKWSKHAVDALNEFLEALKASPTAPSVSVESAVATALQTVMDSPRAGVNLPEMGDTSILEIHIWLPRVHRIVYDVRDNIVRVLWFTDNRTCYRNGKGPVAGTRLPKDAG